MRKYPLAALLAVFVAAVMLCAGALSAQAAKPPLAFEVASVKPSGPLDPQKIMSGQMRIGMKIDKARVDIGAMSLADLTYIAFKVKYFQLSGAPSWINTERFDIHAKMPEGATAEQVPEMLQQLLIERFQMKFHRESAEFQVFALIVGKGGHKLKESPADVPAPDAPPAAPGTVNQTNEGMRMQGRPDEKGGMTMNGPNGKMKMSMAGGVMHMEAEKMTMDQFTETISRFLSHPVVNMTELKGNYQIALDLTMDDMMNAARASGMGMAPPPPPPPGGGGPGGGPVGGGGMMAGGGMVAGSPAPGSAMGDASDPGGSTIIQSVQKMGLKLDPRKAPLDKLIIEHLEKTPTEN